MVVRKPVPHAGRVGAILAQSSPSSSPPPYPVSPSSTDEPQTLRAALRPSADSEPDIETPLKMEGGADVEQSSGMHAYQPLPNEFPHPLQDGLSELPGSVSQEMRRPNPTSTNPFLRRQIEKYGTAQESSTAFARGGFSERSPQPHGTPPRPAVSQMQEDPPCELFASLSTIEPSTNPWLPASHEKAQGNHSPIPMIQREDLGSETWSGAASDRQTSNNSTSETPRQAVLVDIDEPESPAWDEDDAEPSPHIEPPTVSNLEEAQQLDRDRHIWVNPQGYGLEHDTAAPGNFETLKDQTQPGEGWSLVDHDVVGGVTQQTGAVLAEDATQLRKGRELDPTSLPPQPQELPSEPSTPLIRSRSRSTQWSASPEVAASVIQAQKKETYEIKKISWYDVTAAKNLRVSPILVQNANGPCPLLALVNALTLSTPANVETALVETLRSRERVSLGLLLDAVFDELMSGRRGDAAHELPDVSDLYSFLITLHTGMNVNPLFFPPLNKSKNSSQEREETASGTFEDTREMKLYSTFSVPLIHGWLPEPGSTECISLARSAKSYEDAQNLMFHEEELEDKLAHEGLSLEEQATLEDIATIKAFFSSNATQLTPFGLQMITTSLVPGATAILFRNDHFSTLYRHPDTLQLLQLVTDIGYAGHEEVVWESLTDVSGERAEFFSGDFRLVGGASATPSHANINESVVGWNTTTNHREQSHNQNMLSASLIRPGSQSITPQSPNTEQEDHDLALALQLQEEEEERHRNEQARQRRDREAEISQQSIGQRSPRNGIVPVHIRGGRGRGSQNRGRGARSAGTAVARPEIQPRRNNLPSTTTVPAVDLEAGIDAPPPSYEQAANQEAYIPPTDHPSHPTASPNGTTATRRRTTTYSSTPLGTQVQTTPSLGRTRRQTSYGPSIIDHISPSRRSMPPGAAQQQSVAQHQVKERDCIIM